MITWTICNLEQDIHKFRGMYLSAQGTQVADNMDCAICQGVPTYRATNLYNLKLKGTLFGFLTNVYKINVKTQEDPQNLRPCMVTLGPGTQLETLHNFFLFSGSH